MSHLAVQVEAETRCFCHGHTTEDFATAEETLLRARQAYRENRTPENAGLLRRAFEDHKVLASIVLNPQPHRVDATWQNAA